MSTTQLPDMDERTQTVMVIGPDGQPIDFGGGGGSDPQSVNIGNWPETQPVSGTVAVTALATAGSTQQGAIANAAYTDVTGAANGTMISLLKGIFVQLAEINAKTPGP